jgi:Protein of unknown function (DUF4236)
MGLRFSRRIPLVPGLRVNLSKSGASVSVGHRGGWVTIGPGGTRATVGLPGSGLSSSERLRAPPHLGHQANFVFVLVVIAVLIAWMLH